MSEIQEQDDSSVLESEARSNSVSDKNMKGSLRFHPKRKDTGVGNESLISDPPTRTHKSKVSQNEYTVDESIESDASGDFKTVTNTFMTFFKIFATEEDRDPLPAEIAKLSLQERRKVEKLFFEDIKNTGDMNADSEWYVVDIIWSRKWYDFIIK